MSAPTIFAIDFGTSNSLLAAANAHEVFPPAPIDPDASDPTVLRTALYFGDTKGGEFGSQAIRSFAENEFRGRLIRSIKRHLPSRSFTKTLIGRRMVELEDLIGAFLSTMRERARKHFDADVRRVVLGRPARFSNEPEEDALAEARLRRAAERAGFTTIDFCPEPVAAAYDFADDLTVPRVVCIADLGGGTTDYTIVRMHSGGFAKEDVLAVGGVPVAGDAIDGALVRSVVAPHFGSNAQYRVPLGSNVLDMPIPLLEILCSPADLTLVDRDRTLRTLSDIKAGLINNADRRKLERFATVIEDGIGFTLYDEVEAAKRRLSEVDKTKLSLDYPGAEMEAEATRKGLDKVAGRPIDQMLRSLDQVLETARIGADDVEILCLTGGTSRMPLIETTLRKKLPKAELRRLSSFHSVVHGLARHARGLVVT